MSRQNVECVRRMFERWSAGDVDGWLDCWHSDGEYTSVPFEAFEGKPSIYRGHAELRRFVRDVLEGFAGLGQVEPERFFELEDAVVVLGEYRNKGGASGADTTAPMAWRFELRDGRITRGRDFLDQGEALAAVETRKKPPGQSFHS